MSLPKFELVTIGGSDSVDRIEPKGMFYHRVALNRMFYTERAKDNTEFFTEVTLVPEPDNPHSRSGDAISVRWDDEVIGYVASEETSKFQHLKRVSASGLDATIEARVWTNENYKGERDFWISIMVNKGDLLLPLNDPPSDGYSVLPKGTAIQVTKEEHHLGVLTEYLQQTGRSHLLVTLHMIDIGVRSVQPRIEVRLDGQRVGELTKSSSEKYIPVVRHWDDLGLDTVAHARIDGSSIAVQMTLFAARAHELSEEELDPEDTNPLPRLVDFEINPTDYDAPARYQTKPEDNPPKRSNRTFGKAGNNSGGSSAAPGLSQQPANQPAGNPFENQQSAFESNAQEQEITSTPSNWQPQPDFSAQQAPFVPSVSAAEGLPTDAEWIQLLAPDGTKRATPFQRGYVRGTIGKFFPGQKAPRMDYLTMGQAERILRYFDQPTEKLYKDGRNSTALWWTMVVVLFFLVSLLAVIPGIGGIFPLAGLIVIIHHFWTRRKLEFPFNPRKR